LPIPSSFSWSPALDALPFAAQVIAESYFRQVGITTYFVKFETNGNVLLENAFDIPTQGNYNTSYPLEFYKVGAIGLVQVTIAQVAVNFTARNGLRGMRAYALNRINRNVSPWNNNSLVTDLFWKEYSRYFFA
jgi:hypothetical protein